MGTVVYDERLITDGAFSAAITHSKHKNRVNMAVAFEALQVCESLDGILKSTFGPNGLDIMLKSSSGDILVTNNGSLILRSLNLGHPVGRSIVEKILSHASVTGDGASSFLLMLTTMLREVLRHIGIKRTATGGPGSSSTQQKSFLFLSQAFLKLDSTLLDDVVLPVLNNVAVKKEINPNFQDFHSIRENIKSLIYTALNGKFQIGAVCHFGTLLCDMITNTWTQSVLTLKETVLRVIDEFPQICLEVPGVPVSLSHIKRGILIPRQFATEMEGVPETCKNFSFVVASSSFDFSGPETATLFQITNVYSIDLTHKWRRSHVERIISLLYKLGNVKLILSSENLSDLVLHFCRQYNIAAVSMIPLEHVSYICRYAGILPISDTDFENETVPECFLGKGDTCRYHPVAQQNFVHLQIKPAKYHFNPHSLVLASPAQSLCKQNFIALHNALKCVKMSFSQDGREMLLLPGGGSAEFAVSFSLKAYAQRVIDPHLSLCIDIFSAALQSIPRILHDNSFSSCGQKGNFIYCISEVERSWKDSSVLLGIDCKTGKPLKIKQGIYEPLLGKYMLLHSILQCLSQLLKTEKLLGVKVVKGHYKGVENK